MSKATYLAAYEDWVRAGRCGLAPSAPLHGVMVCDALPEICAVDEAVRLESGLGSWRFYAPGGRRPRR